MVLVVLLLPAVLIALFMVFSSAKLTTSKMEVQNAADAAAFSVSTLEARDLNFMAYTNRAMIANDVGIAQMVALTSWAVSLVSVPGQLDVINRNACPRAGAVGGAICSAIFTGLSTYYRTIGNVYLRGMQVLNPLVVRGLNGINHLVYSNAQKIYHGATVYLVANSLLGGGLQGLNPTGGAGVVLDAIDKNAPGARLSPWGSVALAAHVVYYAGDFFPGLLDRVDQTPFLKTYDPSSDDDADGFKTWAAIQRDSRDMFTESRGVQRKDIPALGSGGSLGGSSTYQPTGRNEATCSSLLARVGAPPICPGFRDEFTLPLPPPLDLTIGFSAGGDFGLEIAFGGNELRWNGSSQNGDSFGHQAIDRSSAFISIIVGFDFTLPPLPPIPGIDVYDAACQAIAAAVGGPAISGFTEGRQCTIGTGFDERFTLAFGFAQLQANDVPLELRSSVFTEDIDDGEFDSSGPGWGDRPDDPSRPGTQVGALPFFGLADNLPLYDQSNPVDPSRRGVTRPDLNADFQRAGPGRYDLRVGGPPNAPRSNRRGLYDGLPGYTDTASPVTPPDDGEAPLLGFQAPNFLVGVVKTVNGEHQSFGGRAADTFGTLDPSVPPVLDPGSYPASTGPVELVDRSAASADEPEAANNVVAAIARSQVYFKRPTDLDFFSRPDGNEEYGTAFNPYWQARLVETTELDRAVSLLFQQRVFWDEQIEAIRNNTLDIYEAIIP
ncbi:MAG: hypothetical protein AAGC67_02370 [Myxococcota bacterium]